MAISAETLRRVGIKDTPGLFEDVVSAAITEILVSYTRTDPSTNLTISEQAALRRGGLDLTPSEWGENDQLLATAADYAVLVASGLNVAQAAKLLGVESSRIRQRLGSRTLYGLKDRGTWRLPRFQFTGEGTGTVPNIEIVLPRVRPGVHPIGFWRWFVNPNSELVVGDDDQKLCPRDWLLTGMEPMTVADLAAEL